MSAGTAPAPARALVLDTNVVLDLLLFDDPSTTPLLAALQSHQWVWLSTLAMRDELARVLTYPALAAPLAARTCDAQAVLARFDQACWLQPVAPACPVRCSDPDDQCFIDLAAAHRAWLLSKDQAVLRLRRRLAALAVRVSPVFRPMPAT